jgi:hypothetical protein
MDLIPYCLEPTGAIRYHLLITASLPTSSLTDCELACLRKVISFSGADQSHKDWCLDKRNDVPVSYCHYAKRSLTGLATLQHTLYCNMCSAPPIKCTCIILSDAHAYKKISALPWIHSSFLWHLKAEYDTMDISNNQHHYDSAASPVNLIGTGEPRWHNLFNHCFGCLSTSIWQFGMLIHCHMLPARHTNSPLHYHRVPPLFSSKSVIAGHCVVRCQLWRLVDMFSTALKPWNGQLTSITWPPGHIVCKTSLWSHSLHSTDVLPLLFTQPTHIYTWYTSFTFNCYEMITVISYEHFLILKAHHHL